MKVADLQRFLGNITPFARAAGASEKAAAELDRALQCLEPFKEKSLAEFNDFLLRADEFDRTGKLLPPARNGKTRTPKAPALSVDEAIAIYQDLHNRATDPALTYAEIDAKLKPIGKLNLAQLKEAVAKLDVTVSPKTKKNMVDELTRRIKELKASHERTQFRLGESA